MKVWSRLWAGMGRWTGQEDTAKSARQLLAAAGAARDAGRWKEAAALYEAHARLRPRRVGSRVQLGNMRKQAGDLEGAAQAYRDALAIRPTVEAWTQLGYLWLTSGREVRAIEAFESALALAKECGPAKQGLIAAGARDRLPAMTVDPHSLDRLRRLTDEIAAAIETLADAAVTPLVFYDAWRAKAPLEPPPQWDDEPVTVLIDARGVAPARLRVSLVGLIEQNHASWNAVVIADPALLAHPVASLARTDSRIRLEAEPPLDSCGDPMITMDAGVILDRFAIAWLLFAAKRTSAQAVYADHDHVVQLANDTRRLDPVFQPAPDPDDMATTPSPPALVFWRGDTGAATRRELLDGDIRSSLMQAIRAGVAAHLPMVLSGVLRLSPVARAGLPAPEEIAPGYLEPPSRPVAVSSADDSAEAIRIIIPTRDEVGLLAACVEGLYAHASRPDRLRITIVDNRSREPATRAWLARGVEDGRFSVLAADEPFNWSRLNNLAVAASDESLLLFLNNDTDLLTEGWDVRLASSLGRSEIGVVGARLLYPDLTVQHAGVVLGLGAGGPRHEGVGASRQVGGPQDRWRRSRYVAAVTGAFMGVRRDVYMSAGGFDETRFAIGYNDIDFCLRCRAAGLRILYDADIELIHHESRTRGLNNTRGRMAWDMSELSSMQARWGAALRRDPAVNPHWATVSARPFDGVRVVPTEETLRWLDASIGNPWRV